MFWCRTTQPLELEARNIVEAAHPLVAESAKIWRVWMLEALQLAYKNKNLPTFDKGLMFDLLVDAAHAVLHQVLINEEPKVVPLDACWDHLLRTCEVENAPASFVQHYLSMRHCYALWAIKGVVDSGGPHGIHSVADLALWFRNSAFVSICQERYEENFIMCVFSPIEAAFEKNAHFKSLMPDKQMLAILIWLGAALDLIPGAHKDIVGKLPLYPTNLFDELRVLCLNAPLKFSWTKCLLLVRS
jgi:hypothetical protein